MFTDLEADEDGAVPNVPQRIASRHTARSRPKSPTSLLDCDGNFFFLNIFTSCAILISNFYFFIDQINLDSGTLQRDSISPSVDSSPAWDIMDIMNNVKVM